MKGNIFDKHSRLKPRDGTIACAVARSEAVVRMTLFESISDFLGLSPRRERADRQDQRSPQRSSNLDLPRSTRRSLSPTPRGRTNRTKSRNTFSLSFEPEPEDISPPPRPEPANLVASHSQPTESYDHIDSSPSGTAALSGNLQSPTSLSVTESPSRRGTNLQMVTQSRKRPEDQAFQDEARLLGATYKDPNMTPIRPGQHRNKKRNPSTTGAFKPVDRISSSHFRESGPIRAQGKANQLQSSRVVTKPIEFEGSSRPRKRRCQDDVADNWNEKRDRQNELSPPIDHVSRRSPASSSMSTRSKSHPWAHDEFREVESFVHVSRGANNSSQDQHQFSADSDEEKFATGATFERQTRDKSKNSDRRNELVSVEIPKNDLDIPANTAPRTKKLRKDAVRTNGSRDIRERESSDELQGEVTTAPLPKNLPRRIDQISRQGVQEKLKSPSRKRSPSDIQPTDFAGSPRQGPKRAKNAHKNPKATRLDIKSLRYGSIKRGDSEGSICLVLDDQKLELEGGKIGEEEVKILFRRVDKICHAGDLSSKARLMLKGNITSPSDRQHADIEFSGVKCKDKLVQVLQDLGVNVVTKDASRMDQLFRYNEKQMTENSGHVKRPHEEPPPFEKYAFKPSGSGASGGRRKISSLLQDSNGKPEVSRTRKEDKISDSSSNMDGATESHKISQEQGIPSLGVEIPVKTFKPQVGNSGRETRSTRREGIQQSTPANTDASDTSAASLKDDFRKNWKEPLAYPPTGKKIAEVTVDDRDRLREGEFLNDNIIGFYMRFLQDHLERTNPQVARKVYFFNTYLFEKLTNTPKGETINYSGVEKWTRNVDLFSYDYIVVPINETAHWYMAIICNLPSLKFECDNAAEPSSVVHERKGTPDEAGANIQEILESPEPEGTAPFVLIETEAASKGPESPRSQGARESFATMRLAEAEKGKIDADASEKQDDSENRTPEHRVPDGVLSTGENEKIVSADKKASELFKKKADQDGLLKFFSPQQLSELKPAVKSEVQSSTSNIPVSKGKKKARGPRHDPKQPVIVTFDSLDLSRSPAIRILREYISREAETKRKAKINDKDIKGMRAQNIPLQSNWSDCGLYLLAYAEKFVQDPEIFVTKILQRDMDVQGDWPSLGSGFLRQRLREFLDKLYMERWSQANGQKVEKIMALQQPVSFLLGSNATSQSEQQPVQDPLESTLSDQGKRVTSPAPTSGGKHTQPSPSKEEEGPTGPSVQEPRALATDLIVASATEDGRSGSPEQRVPRKTTDSTVTHEVEEIPDSQEPVQLSSFSHHSSPKRKRNPKATPKKVTRASIIPPSADIVEVGDSQPEEPISVSEVQVKRTPSPK